ncbi:MAG TPA: adenylate/guanylate cyclase domain-containing protein [Gaiellaceae bacterium]
MPEERSAIRTFLIADIRGYTRFTEEYGDEAAARLAAKFKDIVQEVVETRTGRVVEMRGDEALTVFESARQAIRASMDMQRVFADETDADIDMPLRVGIGIDSGEAIDMGDGSYRGAALNIAARLCAAAHGGEVLVSEGTTHLAGRLGGLRYVDRGLMKLKGIEDNVRSYRVTWEEEKDESRSVFMFFGNTSRLAPKLVVIAVLAAALTAGLVVWLTGRGTDESNASPAGSPGAQATLTTGSATGGTAAGTTTEEEVAARLDAIVPPLLWADCHLQTVPDPNALETAVCLPPQNTGKFAPDRWQVSMYPDGKAVNDAYEAARQDADVSKDSGACSRVTWTGEGPWEHGPGQPGGRFFCYFSGENAVMVWTHLRLGQPTHRDILAMAMEGGSDHARLFQWWNPRHHLIGKAQ